MHGQTVFFEVAVERIRMSSEKSAKHRAIWIYFLCDIAELYSFAKHQAQIINRNYFASVIRHREKSVAADTQAAYRYKQMHLYVTYRMTTEYAVSIGGGGIGDQNADMAQLQTYITDSGRECAVFFEKSGDGICSGRGYTVVDAVLIELSLIGRSEENIQQAITEVLEAFG